MIVGTVTKQPSEKFPISIEFADTLIAGETISSVTVTSRIEETGQDSTSTIVSGSATISGSIVTQTVHAGTDQENHIVQMKITSNVGNIYEDEIRLQIRAY